MINPDVFNEVPLFALLDAEEREVLAQRVLAVQALAPGQEPDLPPVLAGHRVCGAFGRCHRW